MTTQEQLKLCAVCTKRGFNPKNGIVCGLTQEKPNFSGHCEHYIEDEKAKNTEEAKAHNAKAAQKSTINKGRYALFIVAGLFLLHTLLEGFIMEGHDILYAYINGTLALIFIGLGIWSFYQASIAMIVGLSVYGLLILLLAVLDPSTILSGIIWKILIVTLLIYGIKTAREEEKKLKNQSNELLD